MDGELVVNAKSVKGLLFQAAGKIITNNAVEKYGLSVGSGFEPGRIGAFLFVDGLAYRFGEYDTTFHFQLRPTIRWRSKRIAATLFYAVGFGD